MTERDIQKVEKKLQIDLPEHYRRFLLEHGNAVAKAKRAGNALPYFTTAKELLEANDALRADPNLQPTQGDKKPWPLKYLIVGSDGAGDHWCVDLKSSREAIWRFDSEAGGIFRRAEVSKWADLLKQVQAPPPAVSEVWASYVCKRGVPTPESEGDGAFAIRDGKGRDWLCFERRERTEAEILAMVRGELRTPNWLGEKGVRERSARSMDELRDALTRER